MLHSVTVHKAKERDMVAIPYSAFLDNAGGLKLNAAINRGLVEVRQGTAGLVLKVGGIVGRLPLNSRHALDISPKFSMGNLTRMVAIADRSFHQRAEISRLYRTTDPDGYMPELLLKSFGIALQHALSEGRHREYQKQTKDTTLRPRINFQKSSQAFWSRGQSTKAVTDQFYFTLDNAENQVLKFGCALAHALSKGTAALTDETVLFGQALNDLQFVSDKSAYQILRQYDAKVSRLPTFKIGHRKAVEIALELIRRAGVSYDHFDTGIELPSFLINLDEVFESYIRHVLQAGLRKHQKESVVGDGNLSTWQKPLFDDTRRGLAKPDLLITRTGLTNPLIVGDVKYKRERDVGAADRYQVIAHALSHRCKKAIIVSPAENNQKPELSRFGKIGGASDGIDVYHYRMDISADIEAAEARLVKEIQSLL